MSEYEYSAGSREEDHDVYGRLSFPAKQMLYGKMWDMVATDLADHFFHNHDGWEHSWPLQFRIYEDGKEVARYSVEQETAPTFHANAIEEGEAA